MRKSRTNSYWAKTFRRVRKNKLAVTGGFIILLLILTALLAPFLANDKPLLLKYKNHWYMPFLFSDIILRDVDFKSQDRNIQWALFPLIPYSPYANNLDENLQSPDSKHWLGTDENGRDVLARMIYGSQVSLEVGILSVSIAVLIGIYLGALAGFYGGWIDSIISRIIEVLMCIPSFFLILAVMALLEPGIDKIMIVIGVTSWTGIARLVRGEFLKIKEEEFVTAAKTLGTTNFKIIFRHILPNALAPVFVSATFGVAGAVLTETALTFLGFGVQVPTASWGEILSQGEKYITLGWWLAVFPGIAIFITVFAYNILGEGLQDALDPRMVEKA
jgi:peptide/nickel transport system permease protein